MKRKTKEVKTGRREDNDVTEERGGRQRDSESGGKGTARPEGEVKVETEKV